MINFAVMFNSLF